MLLILFLYSANLWLVHGDISNRTLYIGGFLPFKRHHAANVMKSAAEIAVKDINSNASVLEQYKLEIIFEDTSPATIADAVTAYLKQTQKNKTFHMILGELYSENTEIIADFADRSNIPQISSVSVKPSVFNRALHPNLVSIREPFSFAFHPLIKMLKKFNWNRVGVWQADIVKQDGVTLTTELKKENISVLAIETIGEDVHSTLKLFEDTDVRVIIGITTYWDAIKMVCKAYHSKKMIGKEYVWIFLTPHSFDGSGQLLKDPSRYGCTNDQIMTAIKGAFTIFQYNMEKYKPLKTIISRKTVGELWKEIQTKEPTYKGGALLPFLMYDAVWLAALAMNKVSSQIAPRKLNEVSLKTRKYMKLALAAISETHFSGASYDISFSTNGIPKGTLAINQFNDDKLNMNKPVNTVGTYEPEDGIIHWLINESDLFSSKGRVVPLDRPKAVEISITSSLRYAFLAIGTIGIIFQIIAIVFHLIYRKNVLFAESLPFVNIVIFIGCILLEVAVMIMAYDLGSMEINPSWDLIASFCEATAWFVVLGFMLSAGLIAVKMAFFIITKEQVIQSVNKWHIAAAVSLCLVFIVEVVLLIVWTTEYDIKRTVMTATFTTTDPFNVLPVYSRCTWSYGWMMTFYILNGSILFIGSFIAWPSVAMIGNNLNKDTSYLVLSTYIYLVVMVVILPAALMVNSDHTHPDVFYGLLGAFILVCTISTTFLLTIPKIITLFWGIDERTSSILAPLTPCLGTQGNKLISRDITDENESKQNTGATSEDGDTV